MTQTMIHLKPILIFCLALVSFYALAQPLVKTDALALLQEAPQAPSTLDEAYQRVYPQGKEPAQAQLFYQSWLAKVERAQLETQQLNLKFYQQHPLGFAQPVQTAPKGGSGKEQQAIEAAMRDLSTKMLADPAFAQQIARMSEAERNVFLAKALADKGLKPAQGTPNAGAAMEEEQTIDWHNLCVEVSQSLVDMQPWEKQTALQQQYEAKHRDIETWLSAAIDKVPMVVYGEYGRDHDMEKVKALKAQARQQHLQTAEAHLQALRPLWQAYRKASAQKMQALNQAIVQVNYGQGYNFGLHYTMVLQTQGMMYAEARTLVESEMGAVADLAQWKRVPVGQ
jgi:hypothetical protein